MRRKPTPSTQWGSMRRLLDGAEGTQTDPIEIEIEQDGEEAQGEEAQGDGVEVEFLEQEGTADTEERQELDVDISEGQNALRQLVTDVVDEEEEEHALSQMDGDVDHNGEALPQLMDDVLEGEEEANENVASGLEEAGEAEDPSSAGAEPGEAEGELLLAADIGDADDTLEENENEHGQENCTKKKKEEAEDLRWGKRALNWTLKEENDDLRKENIDLFNENQDLRQENCRLSARVHHFERKEVRQYGYQMSILSKKSITCPISYFF